MAHTIRAPIAWGAPYEPLLLVWVNGTGWLVADKRSTAINLACRCHPPSLSERAPGATLPAMKRLSLLCACVLALAFAGCYPNVFPDHATQASAAYRMPKDPPEKAARAEIMQLLKDFEKAFRARDLDTIMALYSPDVIAYDIAPPLQYAGVAAYRKTWQNFFDAYEGPLDVDFRDLQLGVSGNIVYTFSLERFTGTLKGGQKSEIWVRVTDVYEKKDGRWRILHEHVSVPVDFATGKAVLDLKP